MKPLAPVLLLLALVALSAGIAVATPDEAPAGTTAAADKKAPATDMEASAAGKKAPVAFETMLTAGPIRVPAPAFEERGRKARSTGLLSTRLLNTLDWPAEGDGEEWLPGRRVVWSETTAADGLFRLEGDGSVPARRVAWLAGYVSLPRWQKAKITVTGTRPFSLSVDGKEKGKSSTRTKKGGKPAEVSAECALIGGKHRIVVKTVDLTEKDLTSNDLDGAKPAPWTIKVEVTPGAGTDRKEVVLSTSPVRTFADMNESKNLTRIGSFALSPDGSILAVTVRFWRRHWAFQESTAIRFLHTATGECLGQKRTGSAPRDLKWSPDGAHLAYRSGNSILRYTLETEQLTTIVRDVKGLGKYLWAPDGRHIYYAASAPKEKKKGHYKLDGLHDRLTDYATTKVLHVTPAAGGARHALTRTGDFAIEDFALSPDGTRLAFVKRYPVEGRPWFRTEFRLLDLPDGGEARLIRTTSFPFENVPKNLTWSPDGKRIAFRAPPDQVGESDRRNDVEHNHFETDLWTLHVESKELLRVSDRFFESVEAPLFWHPTDGCIYFKAHHKTRKHVARIAVDGEAEIELLTGAPAVVSTYTAAAGGTRIAYSGTSITRPVTLHTLNPVTKNSRLVLDPNREFMSRIELGKWERYDFTNKRGQQIDGFIFYPPDFDARKKYPLIVYYYGGTTPEVENFTVTYYHFMPANGYVQYCVNPAGAYGYGEKFSDLHVNDQALLAGEDILEGVEKVIADHDFIDGDNVAGYGGSYGGFMTMSLITRTDRFKASCSMYGIANIASYWGAGIWGYTYGDTAMAKSYPWNRRDIFVDRAPLFNADKVQSALLLLHGLDDTNVPAVESEQMFTALKVLGKECAYVRFPGENHGIASSMDQYILHRRMIVEWFDKYLKNEPGAWEARWKKK